MLMTYDASVEAMNKQKLFSAEHTVRDSALQTQQKQWVKRAQFFSDLNMKFLSTVLYRFVFGGRPAPKVGEEDWRVLYYFRGTGVTSVI